MSTQREPPGHDTRPVTEDEDLLHSSQSAHFHCSARAIRFPGDLDDDERAEIQEQFDAGGFEPTPIQVTTRNRQGDAVRIRSEWDGVQLHLDIAPTAAPRLALQPALAATARYYLDHRAKLAALVLLAAGLLLAVIVGLTGVV